MQHFGPAGPQTYTLLSSVFIICQVYQIKYLMIWNLLESARTFSLIKHKSNPLQIQSNVTTKKTDINKTINKNFYEHLKCGKVGKGVSCRFNKHDYCSNRRWRQFQ